MFVKVSNELDWLQQTATGAIELTKMPVAAALKLVRWQQTRRGYDEDAELIRAGCDLLLPDDSGRFGPQSALSRAEQALNVPWQRLTSEVLQFAVFLVTKAKQDEQLRPHQTREGLRLLQLALNVFAVKDKGDKQLTTLPLNACNLLLSALAETLEKIQIGCNALQTLQDANGVFLYLFGLPSERSAASTANFQMYRPPTNVFALFMKRALMAAFSSLNQLQKNCGEEKDQLEHLYVGMVHAVLFVFQELQKTQTNKKKVFLAIAKTSLRDVVAYRHALVDLQNLKVKGVDSIIVLLDRVVEDALFDVEHIRQFDGAMVHCGVWKLDGDSTKSDQNMVQDVSKAKKKRKGGKGAASDLVSYQKNLFDELLGFLTDSEVQPKLKASAGNFFEVLVRGFSTRIRAAAHAKIEDTRTDLKTSRKRAAIVIATTSTTYSPFKFWSELCAVAYLALQRQADAFLPVLVTVYNALFRVLCECDVYRVTEDTEERDQFQTVEKILSLFLGLLHSQNEGCPLDAEQASEECQIVSSAVKCSPNLVNSCLAPIFRLFNVQVLQCRTPQDADNGCARVLMTASSTVVDLVHAYDSMRLLDNFLLAVFEIQHPEGLLTLFALPSCENSLRKAFMTLPPGQVDVLWNLFVKKIASYASTSCDSRNTSEVSIARLLFQTFIQEVHVVPQNRSKVVALVSHTHEQLSAPLVKHLEERAGSFSTYERELFCVFGELLLFDSVLSDSVREQTFDVVFDKLEGDQFSYAMQQLLSTNPTGAKRHKTLQSANNAISPYSANQGLGAAGIVKVCVYWLRKAYATRTTPLGEMDTSQAEREHVARLVIDYVIRWKCWEAVSFHLPELMVNANVDDCDRFFRKMLDSYLDDIVSGNQDGAARKVICDAEFYEICNLREVAPVSFSSLVSHFTDEVVDKTSTCMAKITALFTFFLDIPVCYLHPRECGKLLLTTVALYKGISLSTDNDPNKTQAVCNLLEWVRSQFKTVGLEVYRANDSQLLEQLRDGVRFIISQLVVDKSVSVALVAEVFGYYLDIGDNVFVKELLTNVIEKKKQAPTKFVASMKRVIILVKALALSGKQILHTPKEEKNFINDVVDSVTRDNILKSLDGSLSLEILNALLKYQSLLYIRAHRNKQQLETGTSLMHLLVKRVGNALAVSMKVIVAQTSSFHDCEHNRSAWTFFKDFCEEYPSFRLFVTPLETYGCLLAASLSLVSNHSASALEQTDARHALNALVTNANQDEYRLLLATILKELVAGKSSRKISALRALCLLLGGDRKVHASRRQALNERKESVVQTLLHNFSDQSLRIGVTSAASELSVLNLKAFVQVFCKAELFTWKTHELQHVFTGFQPLIAAVSSWDVAKKAYSLEQLDELWTLSYTLLLRVIRNHFASLVNGIPHFVQAANALLRMIVLVSVNDKNSRRCSEWSSNLARLYGYMKEHDVQLRKHVVYLLMTFLVGVTRDKLEVRYQQKLRPGVFALLDVCSPYEKEQLYAALDSTGKSLLKTLDTNYKLTHRYVGKV